ncbi:MAG: glucose-6-phosphate dehydrogenase assembly protein OpcA [Nocardioides sp.]|nr:glucose-6-phosphate dehydrogenase assembly protein OpcA [Nocardioides sp.]
MIELDDTTASAIAAEFVRNRTRAGSPAMGMVMTLIVVVGEDDCEWAMDAARESAREHPARVLGVILGSRRGAPRVDAQVGVGQAGWTGETALIRLSGRVVDHPESVVAPLLLPDSPVVVWWPTDHPDNPGLDPLGALANRRITDAAHVTRGKRRALVGQCTAYRPGNTDLAWTRITPWRGVLAAVLDQHPAKVRSAEVSAERISPSADLMVAWLSRYLSVPVKRRTSEGPGITEVVLTNADGVLRIHRGDGKMATFSSPGRPDQVVALKRRELPELLAEELRHLDEDDIYAEVTTRALELEEERS